MSNRFTASHSSAQHEIPFERVLALFDLFCTSLAVANWDLAAGRDAAELTIDDDPETLWAAFTRLAFGFNNAAFETGAVSSVSFTAVVTCLLSLLAAAIVTAPARGPLFEATFAVDTNKPGAKSPGADVFGCTPILCILPAPSFTRASVAERLLLATS